MYKELGWSYQSVYMFRYDTAYMRLNIYFKKKLIHTEDIFGVDMYYLEQVFNRYCRLNQRDQKLNQLFE